MSPLRKKSHLSSRLGSSKKIVARNFMLPHQPQPPPTLSAGAAFASPMAVAQQEQFDDDDDKSKVSRWQIGSSSMTVLEQVYAMEPFPGKSARARPDLLFRGGA